MEEREARAGVDRRGRAIASPAADDPVVAVARLDRQCGPGRRSGRRCPGRDDDSLRKIRFSARRWPGRRFGGRCRPGLRRQSGLRFAAGAASRTCQIPLSRRLPFTRRSLAVLRSCIRTASRGGLGTKRHRRAQKHDGDDRNPERLQQGFVPIQPCHALTGEQPQAAIDGEP